MTTVKYIQTDLDRALERHPSAEQSSRMVDAAAQKVDIRQSEVKFYTTADAEHALDIARLGQLATAAASLAAGMIAADGKHLTAAEAVDKAQDVMAELQSRL